MTIKAVTYHEAWCDCPGGPHQVELGEFSAFATIDQVEDSVMDSDGYIHPDGRLFCRPEHVPDDVCVDTSTGEHLYDEPHDLECAACGRERVITEAGQ